MREKNVQKGITRFEQAVAEIYVHEKDRTRTVDVWRRTPAETFWSQVETSARVLDISVAEISEAMKRYFGVTPDEIHSQEVPA